MVMYDCFFAMAIIICGYGYVIMGVFIRDALSYILMLFGLTGLSALFSFMVFMDKNMWAGSPDLTLSVITGFFTATVIFYMFYVLIYSLCCILSNNVRLLILTIGLTIHLPPSE